MENITTKAFGNYNIDNDIAYFKRLKRKKILGKIALVLVYTLLGAWTLLTIFPFLWTLLNSLKTMQQVQAQPFGFANLTMVNYKNLFSPTSPVNVWRGYMWSLLISVVVVIVAALISAFAAFFLARYKGWYTRYIYIFVIACMMFPIFSTIFPVFLTFQKMGWLDPGSKKAYWAIVLPQIAGNLMFTITLLTGFIKSLPIEVEESAYMDGASTFRTILFIIFPMIKSAFATSAIFIFIWSYNDLFLQQIMLSNVKEIKPLSLVMVYMTTREAGFNAGLAFAAVMLICLPVIIVYVSLQRFIIKGLTAGAVKG